MVIFDRSYNLKVNAKMNAVRSCERRSQTGTLNNLASLIRRTFATLITYFLKNKRIFQSNLGKTFSDNKKAFNYAVTSTEQNPELQLTVEKEMGKY